MTEGPQAPFSGFEAIAYAFDGGDVVFADFLAEFADMYVDRAVAHDHFRAPYLGVDLVARDQFPRS